jgi:hypothetical protein
MANFVLIDDHYLTITIDGVDVYSEFICSKTRFKVITEVLLKKMQVLRCDFVSMGEYFRHFAGSQCLHLQSQAVPEDEGTTFLRNVGNILPKETTLQLRRLTSEAIKNLKLQKYC